jgi:intracellular multiplication protein IcmL
MAESTISTDSFKRSFHKGLQHSFLIKLVILSAALNFIFIMVLTYKVIYPLEPKYYGTITEGRTFPLIALTEPNQSDGAVTEWANQAAISAFTLDFVNYPQQLEQASQYFTKEGWEQFLESLQQGNNIEQIRQKRLTVTAVAQNTPVILQKGVLNGRYSWRIQLPILITYQSSSSIQQQTSIITMLVIRISTLESYRGIGISQFIVGSPTGGIG